jgi:hypothetical protein
MTDDELLDQIEAIRARNNQHWMGLVKLAVRVAPAEAKALLAEIARLDGEVRTLTQHLSEDT